ncbi:MAG: hypothetical protein HFG15_01085 [Bacilli bacterium]|jgi:hypothetical protein|nr:hypothetical protein [Bacilli bacterium]
MFSTYHIYIGKVNKVVERDGQRYYYSDNKYSAFERVSENQYRLLIRSKYEQFPLPTDTLIYEMIAPLKSDVFVDDLYPVIEYLVPNSISSSISLSQISSCVAKANRLQKTYQKHF